MFWVWHPKEQCETGSKKNYVCEEHIQWNCAMNILRYIITIFFSFYISLNGSWLTVYPY